ncbi:MAG: hypothetical protein FP815_13355 [Desulfobulbaceae bacterium]|nr:hypothetical protein [Desulfobulbaceae bacterium]
MCNVFFDRLKALLPQTVKMEIKRLLQNTWETALYRLSRNSTCKAGELRHIIFVCKGNICRSAFAEYYLRSICSKRSFNIESCGLDVDQGIFSPKEAVIVGQEFGIKLEEHYSKGLAACEIENADLIVPMEYGQYIRLAAMLPNQRGKIRLLRDFAPWPDRITCNINDPFGLGEGEFRRCFLVMAKALDMLHIQMSLADKRQR